MNKRIIIALCGENYVGKTTTAEYLRFKYGMKSYSYSQLIAEKYSGNSKEELQVIGAQISENEDQQKELTDYMIEQMDSNASYVIDGLRHLTDYYTLKKQFGDDFIVVALECTYKNRYKRCSVNHSETVSLEKLDTINHHETKKDNVLVKTLADYHIDNNKAFYTLRDAIDEIISKECGL